MIQSYLGDLDVAAARAYNSFRRSRFSYCIAQGDPNAGIRLGLARGNIRDNKVFMVPMRADAAQPGRGRNLPPGRVFHQWDIHSFR